MKQRAGLARALAADASILLMDEAFSALDPLIRRDMQVELVTLQKRLRKTIVFVSHDLDEAIALGGRIALMMDGAVVQDGSAESILAAPATPYVARFVEHIDVSGVLRVGTLADPAGYRRRTIAPRRSLRADMTLARSAAAAGRRAGRHPGAGRNRPLCRRAVARRRTRRPGPAPPERGQAMAFDIPRFPLDELCDSALDWLTAKGAGTTRVLSHTVSAWVSGLTDALQAVPPWAFIIVAGVLAWRATNWRLGVLTAVGLCFLWNLGLWLPMIATLVLVVFSTAAAVLIGLPIGIVAALNNRTWKTVAPCMDVMQTMPSFVYLIPAIPFFGLGAVSACFATIIFAAPPTIRLTALGILQVPHEMTEAADAFGCTPWQKLIKVQLPQALPTIMAGINQTIMLALSMVVIAAMIGAGGLGREVWSAIQRLEAGRGFQAGIAIAVLAVILDRVTQGISRRARTA